MLIINVIFLLLFLAGTVWCFLNQKEWMKGINKKEHKLYFLYPLADFFITKTHCKKVLMKKTSISDSIKAIYITNKQEPLRKLYWCNRISMIAAILFIFNLFSIFGQLEAVNNYTLKAGKYLERPSYGEGSREVELKVTMEKEEGKEASNRENASITQDLTINVKEQEYTSDKVKALFEEAIQFLEINVLGKNEASDFIYAKLSFCDTIPGTSITVEWNPEDFNLIQSDGTVKNENINEKGRITNVKVVLTYLEYQTEHLMSFRIMPKQYSEEEVLQKKLKEEIANVSEKTAKGDYLELPVSLENYRLRWENQKKNTGMLLFLFGIVAAVFAWLMGDQELEKQMKQRRDQMLMDYPEMINKFTLLVNAGMTVKQAWIKAAEDYSSNLSKNKCKKRYAYEEMLVTVHELKLGVAENIAYEQYGRRIGLISYIKFSSLIAQNLKKGNKGFTELLGKEAIEAFEERKEAAKRLGEEAGTKLLLPMMLMLIIVFMIILIPAFWSF